MFQTLKKQSSRNGWKIYFWFVAALLALKYVSLFFIDESFYKYFTRPIPIIPLAGLYGYAYRKTIIGAVFWKIWLFLILILEVVYHIIVGRTILSQQDIVFAIILRSILFVIMLPEYIALYFYAFKSQELWESETSKEV
ncbi:MAG: hypothetical protein JW786_13720 [Desulfobacterales bacterium]|nr:hypothetical protein [Desulfobacterales bacterium]